MSVIFQRKEEIPLPNKESETKRVAILLYPEDITEADREIILKAIRTLQKRLTEIDRVKNKDIREYNEAGIKITANEKEIVPVRCMNGKTEIPFILEGKAVCTATHPSNPIRSNKSRGRVVHLANTEKLTVCNMLIDQYVPGSEPHNCQPFKNGKCKVCFKQHE